MLYFVASLGQIAAGINAPDPEVVVQGMDSLREAPEALRSLVVKEESEGWWVVNRQQVVAADAVAGLGIALESSVGELGRALEGMVAASLAVERVGETMGLHWHYPVQTMGSTAVRIVRVNAIGRLDDAHQELSSLLQTVYIARGRPLETSAIGRARPSPPLGWTEDGLLSEMQRAVLVLLAANRMVKNKIEGVGTVVRSIEQFRELRQQNGEFHNGISSSEPEVGQMATTLLFSARELLGRLDTADGDPVTLADTLEGQVREELNAPLILNHLRFTGPMEVLSLRDLDAVVAAWRPHQAEAGPPPNPVMINISRVNVCSEAAAMYNKVKHGVRKSRWTVYGLNCLAAARDLDARLVTLRATLTFLTGPDGMSPLGDNVDNQVLQDMEEQVEKINRLISAIDGGILVSAEAGLVVLGVHSVITMAKSEEKQHKAWDKARLVIRNLDIARSTAVLFVQ